MGRVLDALGDRVLRAGPSGERDPDLLAEDEDAERDPRRRVDQQRGIEVRVGGAALDDPPVQPALSAHSSREIERRRSQRVARGERGERERQSEGPAAEEGGLSTHESHVAPSASRRA